MKNFDRLSAEILRRRLAERMADASIWPHDAVADLVAVVEPDRLIALATLAVLEEIEDIRRREVLQHERAATRMLPLSPTPKQLREAAPEQVEEWRDRRAAADAADAESWSGVWADLKRATDEFAASLKIRWTRELLDSELHLPDGTVTTWGAATIEQHSARADMFTKNAVANAEGAARHLYAVQELQRSGSQCLDVMVGRSAE